MILAPYENIIFSKLFSTLLLKKEDLPPIFDLNQEQIETLTHDWYKLLRSTAQNVGDLPSELLLIGYYSVFGNNTELGYAINVIYKKINSKAINKNILGFSKKELASYEILLELDTLLCQPIV